MASLFRLGHERYFAGFSSWILHQPDEIYDALKQGDVLVRLGGLRVLRIGDDVYANGEKIDSPHRPALEALASHIVLTAENWDALEDLSFLAMLAALVNSGYWFFKGNADCA